MSCDIVRVMRRHLRIAVSLLACLTFASSLFAQTREAKTVEVYGQKISYLEAGSGPPVILLHGMGANKNHWLGTIAALSPKFHVYAPDQLGFGASDKPLINYRVATLVDFLGEFMRSVQVPRASLVGNSLGGWVAASFAAAHPDRVERLVLADAAGYYVRPVKREEIAFLNPSTLADARHVLERVFANKQFVTDAAVERFYIDRLRAGDSYTIERFIDSAVRAEDSLNDQLKTIKAPTLVTWGKEDDLLPVELADVFAREIPGAQKVIFEKCGHAPHFECATAFHAAILKFLANAPD